MKTEECQYCLGKDGVITRLKAQIERAEEVINDYLNTLVNDERISDVDRRAREYFKNKDLAPD